MKQILVYAAVCLFMIELILASQLYLPFSPAIKISNEVWNALTTPEGQTTAHSIITGLTVNIKNHTYNVNGSILHITAYRDKDEGLSFYSVKKASAVAIRPDLNFNYSIYAAQLDTLTSAARIHLSITNRTHVVVVGYHVGALEPSRIPDQAAPNYSYCFFQVDNRTDIWIKDQRNIFQDLLTKNITLDENWVVDTIHFGFYSNAKGLNPVYDAYFNLNQTTFFYSNLTNIYLTPQFPRVSPTILTVMVIILIVEVAILGITIKSAMKEKFKNRVQ